MKLSPKIVFFLFILFLAQLVLNIYLLTSSKQQGNAVQETSQDLLEYRLQQIEMFLLLRKNNLKTDLEVLAAQEGVFSLITSLNPAEEAFADPRNETISKARKRIEETIKEIEDFEKYVEAFKEKAKT